MLSFHPHKQLWQVGNLAHVISKKLDCFFKYLFCSQGDKGHTSISLKSCAEEVQQTVNFSDEFTL